MLLVHDMPPVRALCPLWEAVNSSKLGHRNRKDFCYTLQDINQFKTPKLPIKKGDTAETTFKYEGFDYITLVKEVERTYTIPEPQTPQEVIGYYARQIAQEVKLPSQFASLAPRIKEFFEKKAFGREVN